MIGRFGKLVGAIHPRLAVVCHDLVMVAAAWLSARALRNVLFPGGLELTAWSAELIVVLVGQGIVLYYTGLYRGLWRFASLPDLWNILRASIGGTLLVALGLVLLNRVETTPRSVFLIYPLMLTIYLGTPRLLYRFWKDNRHDLYRRHPRQRVLVLGAGQSGDLLSRELRRGSEYSVVGFLDDDSALRGSKIHSVPVLGAISRLQRIAEEVSADRVIIAMPSATNLEMQRVVEHCEQCGLPFLTLPRLSDMVNGRSAFNELKPVDIDDLLGREPISLDWEAIRSGLSGRTVLVTGGGGSIGSELSRQLAKIAPAQLVILENSEHNLYEIDRELRRAYPDLVLESVLGDVCDPAACEKVLDRFHPDAIFHAAAYKHVPLLQGQIREAVRNNVLGTRVIAKAADQAGVGIFVLISTDKAVNPTNVMGASKRVAETYCQNLASRSRTRFTTVRFGNVLNSAGSVVPLFQEQIERGGPVTVTHPEISRYFMTIPEACQLIMQASLLGEGGEIFVLDMGEPVKIIFLAEQMIKLRNPDPKKKIDIVYTGLRPGEKLFEELFHEHESYRRTDYNKILLARFREVHWDELNQQLVQIEQAVERYDDGRLKELLAVLVPELVGDAHHSRVVPLNAHTRTRS